MTAPNEKPGAVRTPMQWTYAHALLFTGHMIDRSGRKAPRFPAAAEGRAQVAIDEAIRSIRNTLPGAMIGIAGAASGGDLLFHEVCAERGIPTLILLPLPVREYLAASVAPAGPAWERRFHDLLSRLGPEHVRFLGEGDGLYEGETANIWQRANLWMLEQSLALAPERTLLAMWDGRTGDGPGGTEHLVEVAKRFGVHIAPILDMQRIAGG